MKVKYKLNKTLLNTSTASKLHITQEQSQNNTTYTYINRVSLFYSYCEQTHLPTLRDSITRLQHNSHVE